VYVDNSIETGHDIWTFRPTGDRQPRPLLNSRYQERAPAISRDGRFLAYSSDESGSREIYVQPFPGLGAKWLVSSGGGDDPVWSRDGRELFYSRRLGDQIWAASVRTQPEFRAEAPRRLLTGRYVSFPNMPWTDYDVAPDGRRFLMVKMEDGTDASALVMVVNWAEELKVRLPGPR
jgi:serine/threonine-protein kinase